MSQTQPTDIEPAESPGGGLPGLPPDWPHQATTRIVEVIDAVRVKTTGPAIGVSRTVVYGLVIALLAPIAIALLLIAAIRGLDELFPGEVGPIYLIIGGVLTLAGLVLWTRRPRGAAG